MKEKFTQSSIEQPDDRTEEINKLEQEILHPDKETFSVIEDELNRLDEQGKTWEFIIVGGEAAELKMDVLSKLTGVQKEKIQLELKSIRDKMAENPSDYENAFDFARCIYRLQNIGIEHPPLTDSEKEILRKLPIIIREDEDWPKGHLAYIPQIAQALSEDPKTLIEPEDGELAKEAIQEELKKGGDEELRAMMISSGLLTKFDRDAALDLLKSKEWDGQRWRDALFYIEEVKKQKDGWILSRTLPQMQEVIKLKSEKFKK